MKKLIYITIAFFGMASFSLAQEAKEIAKSISASELVKSKSSGVYVLTLPNEVTTEMVEKNVKYYTHYFTVAFNQSSHTATITMIDNQPKNRTVIARFLTACGVRYVSVDKSNLTLEDFMKSYLE
jgi:hypothetical protein